MLPLTLRLYKSNFKNIVKALIFILKLNKGIFININSEEVFICIFTLLYINDILQQQENSGFKNQYINLSCYLYFIKINVKGNLKYNIISNEQYHHQVKEMRCNIKFKQNAVK